MTKQFIHVLIIFGLCVSSLCLYYTIFNVSNIYNLLWLDCYSLAIKTRWILEISLFFCCCVFTFCYLNITILFFTSIRAFSRLGQLAGTERLEERSIPSENKKSGTANSSKTNKGLTTPSPTKSQSHPHSRQTTRSQFGGTIDPNDGGFTSSFLFLLTTMWLGRFLN